jgi:hypothetical protein
MADRNDHYDIEVLGTCMTNSTAGSQHTQTIDAKYLWSYAQEEALVAVSEKGGDGCFRLIADPERRAKRIAARYVRISDHRDRPFRHRDRRIRERDRSFR